MDQIDLLDIYVDFGELVSAVFLNPDALHPYYLNRLLKTIWLSMPRELRDRELLGHHLEQARRKHPVFAVDIWEGFSVIAEHLGNISSALNRKQPRKAWLSQVADLYAVTCRFQETFL